MPQVLVTNGLSYLSFWLILRRVRKCREPRNLPSDKQMNTSKQISVTATWKTTRLGTKASTDLASCCWKKSEDFIFNIWDWDSGRSEFRSSVNWPNCDETKDDTVKQFTQMVGSIKLASRFNFITAPWCSTPKPAAALSCARCWEPGTNGGKKVCKWTWRTWSSASKPNSIKN